MTRPFIDHARLDQALVRVGDATDLELANNRDGLGSLTKISHTFAMILNKRLANLTEDEMVGAANALSELVQVMTHLQTHFKPILLASEEPDKVWSWTQTMIVKAVMMLGVAVMDDDGSVTGRG